MNFIRSASDWGRNELMPYSITVTATPPEQFFSQGANRSLTDLDPPLITAPLDATDVSDDTYRFLTFLDLATKAGQTVIDDFALELLRIVSMEEGGLILGTHHTIPLSICGDLSKVPQTNTCLLDRRLTILFVFQEDKTIFSLSDPEPQLVADAIAACQYNNQKRQCMDLPALNTMIVLASL